MPEYNIQNIFGEGKGRRRISTESYQSSGSESKKAKRNSGAKKTRTVSSKVETKQLRSLPENRRQSDRLRNSSVKKYVFDETDSE